MGQNVPVNVVRYLNQAPVTNIKHPVRITYYGGSLLYINMATNVMGMYVALKMVLHIST
jgi:hypothetical protein